MAEIEKNEMVELETHELVQPASYSSVEALEKSVQQADRYFQLHDQIRMLAIKMTNRGDWIDQNGTPYLEYTGATKIAKAFGVRVYGETPEQGPKVTREDLRDDDGAYYIYHVEGCAEWNNTKQHQIGTCSTRDKFFGHKNGGHKPLSEVDLTNVRKKAFTNFLNRSIKTLLGLSFTWEEIEEMSGGRITKEGSTHFTYASGTRGGRNESANAGKKRSEFAKALMEKCSNDKPLCETILEIMTRYKDKPGKKSFKNLTEKQINFLMKNIDDQFATAEKIMHEEKIQMETSDDNFNPDGYGM